MPNDDEFELQIDGDGKVTDDKGRRLRGIYRISWRDAVSIRNKCSVELGLYANVTDKSCFVPIKMAPRESVESLTERLNKLP